jgi:hypothetical protein
LLPLAAAANALTRQAVKNKTKQKHGRRQSAGSATQRAAYSQQQFAIPSVAPALLPLAIGSGNINIKLITSNVPFFASY